MTRVILWFILDKDHHGSGFMSKKIYLASPFFNDKKLGFDELVDYDFDKMPPKKFSGDVF